MWGSPDGEEKNRCVDPTPDGRRFLGDRADAIPQGGMAAAPGALTGGGTFAIEVDLFDRV
jgi:hypothetical protein